jgi:predicted PhzF superfamily epimerase YddE/YHI9
VAVLHVLRVFTAVDGSHGNALGVFLDGAEVPEERRQPVARHLGFAETVLVDDRERGEMRIFTPEVQLPFAGHPSVGTAWLLAAESGREVTALRPPAGELWVHREGELTWIAARPEWSPPFEYVEHGSPGEVDSLEPVHEGFGSYCWAWEDEPAGRIRARSFAAEAGITEDEATGSAALALAARLGRSIEIRQGAGSQLLARPMGDGRAEVGGRVVLDEVRGYTVDSR